MSEIKVDKLQGTSGSDTAITFSGANATIGGTLAVTGVHTVGNNAIYTSDGGAVTQNLVQGLSKSFCSHSLSTTINESFNTSSVADLGTGTGRQVYTNPMSVTKHLAIGNAQGGAHNTTFLFHEITNVTTAQNEHNQGTSASNGANTLSDGDSTISSFGDLA